MSGRFVVLEALDGVGKTTLVRALAERLGGVVADTPGPVLRRLSPEVLGALGAEQEARALFYTASVIAEGRRARALADAGGLVLMDRYWLSTISYAIARGADRALECLEAWVPAPDLTVLLTLDETERQRRLAVRGCTAADRETLDARFREVVLTEMTSPDRAPHLRPGLVFDTTGRDVEACVDGLVAALSSGLAHPRAAA